MSDQQTRREHLAAATRIVVGAQFGSVATVQRKLGITHAETVNLMVELERYDIVGPVVGTKPRAVLVAPDGLAEVLDQIRGGA